MQSLENRILPATITVTSLDDNLNADGFITLREAIQAANTNKAVDGSVAGTVGEDTIVFAPALDTSAGLI
ncbi:MAG: CSLREA domain-containing protein, partial [Planctomycetaceae bacterium]